MKETLISSFSGGLTSSYMGKWLKDNLSEKYNILYVFANTGLEHPKTLDFVNKCDQEWSLNIVWLEAVINQTKNKGTAHKIVNYETACRDRSIFEDMVKAYGIPNKAWPHCSRELKEQPILSWKRSLGLTKCKYAIGIRVDEIDRMSPKAKERNIIYPLITANPTTKEKVKSWWKDQSFDLGIQEHYGNCVTCWKKSKRKQLTIAKNTPEYYKDFDYLEQTYPDAGRGNELRQFNSGARFGQDTISIREIVYKSITESFEEFKEADQSYQYDVFYDSPDGCEESCEAFL